MIEKEYPTEDRGRTDAGTRAVEPAICCKRIDHRNELEGALHMVTWCTLPEGHAGQCSGPVPRVLETNDFMRGMK